MKLPVILITWVVAIVVGVAGTYSVLSPQLEDEKRKVAEERENVEKAEAATKELEELLADDAVQINAHMQLMNENIEKAEEEVGADSLENVDVYAKELGRSAEIISELTPVKNEGQVAQFGQLATQMKQDSDDLEGAVKGGDLARSKELVHKLEDGCVFCHPLFRLDNAEIHPESHHQP